MDSIFETLMGLPLFRGVTRERISAIVGTTKFHFLKYLPDNYIIHAGDECTHLSFILTGSVRMVTTSDNGRFRIAQTLHAGDSIMPYFLYGRNTHYPCDIKALEPCNILKIRKADYLRILNADPIFMINLLNIISTGAQNAIEGVLAVATGSLEDRLAVWIVCMTQPTATGIVLSCKQRDLYSVLGVQRSSFLATINSMQERGLIKYSNDEITVCNRRALQNLITGAPSLD